MFRRNTVASGQTAPSLPNTSTHGFVGLSMPRNDHSQASMSTSASNTTLTPPGIPNRRSSVPHLLETPHINQQRTSTHTRNDRLAPPSRSSSSTSISLPHQNSSNGKRSPTPEPTAQISTGYMKSLFIDQNSVEDYTCCICFEVARNPYDIPCGHTICQYCMDHYLKASTNAHRPGSSAGSPTLQCPQCRTPFVEFPLRTSRIVQRKITSMMVKCEFYSEGCTWQGIIGENDRNLQAHLQQCACRRVPCPQCEQPVSIAVLDEHKVNECDENFLNCSQCELTMKRRELQLHSQNEIGCSTFAFCPHGCTWDGQHIEGSDNVKNGEPLDRIRKQHGVGAITIVYADEIASHKQVCPMKPMLCSICNQQMIRSQLEQHMAGSVPLHMSILVQQVNSLQVEIGTVKTFKADMAKLSAELTIARAENRQMRNEIEYLKTVHDPGTDKSKKKWFNANKT